MRIAAPTTTITDFVLGIATLFISTSRACVGFREHINHNDLYHFVQLIAFYVLYRGATALPTG